MKARLVPLHFSSGKDSEFDKQLRALTDLLADQADILPPVALGEPLPPAVVFDLENMNHLMYYNAEDPAGAQGFRAVQATEGCHPYISAWWPPGHAVGYENTFVNEFADFFTAIAQDTKPEPGFEAGLENQKVLDAVLSSIQTNGWIDVK